MLTPPEPEACPWDRQQAWGNWVETPLPRACLACRRHCYRQRYRGPVLALTLTQAVVPAALSARRPCSVERPARAVVPCWRPDVLTLTFLPLAVCPP